MKIETKTYNIYVCDICSTEYKYERDATTCELTHQRDICPHTNVKYTLEGDGYSADIVLICEACGPFYHIGNKMWSLTQLYNVEDEEPLKQIVDIIEKYRTRKNDQKVS